jgi:hypothetical protein
VGFGAEKGGRQMNLSSQERRNKQLQRYPRVFESRGNGAGGSNECEFVPKVEVRLKSR